MTRIFLDLDDADFLNVEAAAQTARITPVEWVAFHLEGPLRYLREQAAKQSRKEPAKPRMPASDRQP